MPQIPFEQALQIVAAQTHPEPATEQVGLLACVNRILAEPVLADRDQPPFARSTRDGYAVRATDLAQPLRVLGQVRAGETWTGPALQPGEAIQIMTGAPVPAGADSVLMVEHIALSGTTLTTSRSLSAGENIVPQAAEARAGQPVLARGTLIGAAEIALSATCGQAHLTVFAKPTVAVIATGDELVELDVAPSAQQIRNSNSYAIAALVAGVGAIPNRLAIAPDTREGIRERIREGRQSDLLVFSGGVSMGDYDLVEEVLAEFGAEFHFTGVQMQPGKPVVFGLLPAREGLPARPFFGLPGNPISTEVTFHCFVSPFLKALSGALIPTPRWAQATLAEAVAGKPNLTRLLPAHLDGIEVRLIPWHGSGDLAANARANCYAELLPGRDHQPGNVIRILLR